MDDFRLSDWKQPKTVLIAAIYLGDIRKGRKPWPYILVQLHNTPVRSHVVRQAYGQVYKGAGQNSPK